MSTPAKAEHAGARAAKSALRPGVAEQYPEAGNAILSQDQPRHGIGCEAWNPMIQTAASWNLMLCSRARRARSRPREALPTYGRMTELSHYSAKETVERFEAAIKAREAAGFIVFTEIDNAAAAKGSALICDRARLSCLVIRTGNAGHGQGAAFA